MNQKGFSPIFVVLGIIITLGLVGGAYYLGTKNNQPPKQNMEQINSPQPVINNSIKPDTLTSWQNYENKEFGLSMQLPPEMTLISEGWLISDKKWYISWSNKSKEETAKTGSDYSITIQIEKNATNSKGETVISDNMDTLYIKDFEVDKTQLNNRPTHKFQANFHPNGATKNYYILDGSILIYLTGATEDTSKYPIAEIEKILATFQFTN